MRTFRTTRWLAALLLPVLLTVSFHASPEDIDIFSVDEGTNLNVPNVLIVLDNTSNWSRASQQWPGGEDQGQSEVAAIKQVINELEDGALNIGLMEYVTGGSSGDTDFGYIRSHIRPMNATNKASLSAKLQTIYDNINSPDEKRSSSNPYGNIMWDIYNYLAGDNQANGGAGTLASLADTAGYDINYSNFRSPLTSNDTCTRTIVIFIGNNVNGTITADSAANVAALRALATAAGGTSAAGDAAVAQIKHAGYTVTTTEATTNIGYSACQSSITACNTAASAPAVCSEEGFTSCACDAADVVACPSAHWNVVGTSSSTTTTQVSDTTTNTPNQYTGENPQCQKNAPNGACTLPPASSQTYSNQNCPTTASSCMAASGYSSTITTSWTGTCTYINSGVSCGTGGKVNWQPSGNKRERSVVTRTDTVISSTPLGETTACYNDQASCNPNNVAGACAGYSSCTCTTAGSTSGCGAGSTSKYMVKGTYNIVSAQQTGTFTAAPPGPYMMDEWARFMRQTGVTVPGLSTRNQVTTYVIDTFNAQQSAELSGLWFNTARVGGGKYFQAKDKSGILTALRNIFTEVQAVNSAFSSASLPINATNRTQNENQVFIGVFKPDRTKDALWFGNLKRYQIFRTGADLFLGDSLRQPAINNQTGFLSECAVSFWTTDSGAYWSSVITDDPEALGICSTNSTDDASDLPDGPFVEKGAAAEVLRKGNNPSAVADGSGNFAFNRTVKTASGGSLVDFTAANIDDGDPATDEAQETLIVNFIRGQDVDDYDDNDGNLTEPRSGIHGDVVHSRPQPVNYGGTTGIVIYYGTQDGTFRAVKASNGQELWSFVAPEHFGKLKRLLFSGKSDLSQPIKYFGDSTGQPKDYFFDGSTGLFQSFNADNTSSRAWIFPSMRRGGRKMYAFNVSDPANPVLLWRKGCPNLTNDTGCDTGFSGIGQTWSIARPMFLKGYSTTRPVVAFGGGYDRCDDDDSTSPCAATKGRGVYIVDAQDGTLVKHFDFSSLSGVSARGVAADVAPISVNPDLFVDYLYAADTGGNIYRMDFVDGPSTLGTLATADWRMSRIAYTNGAGRKFLFTPSLLQNGVSTIYLALGSGDREHPLMGQYPFTTPVTNRFYVFKDDISDTDASTSLNLDSTTSPNNMANYTTDPGCAGEPVTPGSAKRGWFMDLTANGVGEQVVTSAVVAAGFINFSTNRPTPPDALACSNSLGEARGYFVNLLNSSGEIGVDGTCGGSRSSIFVGGGLPPSPVIATTNVDGKVETVIIGAVPKEGGSGSPLEANAVELDLDSKRRPVYWYKSTGEN